MTINQKPDTHSPAEPEETEIRERYAVRITDHIHGRIRDKPADDPVARQYVPSQAELNIRTEELQDPIGDDDHSPVKGLVHRHPDRVLLHPVMVCAVYCRFCFRREKVGPGRQRLSELELDTALGYIKNHEEIREVILTGGDPLILSPRYLHNLLFKLNQIFHLDNIRIHTRVPVADPKRITDKLGRALRHHHKPLYISLHINHPDELSSEAGTAIDTLSQAGAVLLSQSVLLRRVNDDPDTLEALCRALIRLGIQPYYLHHPDLAPGTGHFRLPIARGKEIMAELRRRLSGLACPDYMLDIPGGFGKISLESDRITRQDHNTYIIRDYQQRTHTYTESYDD